MKGDSLTRRSLVLAGGKALGAIGLGSLGFAARPKALSSCEHLRGERISWLVGWSPGGGYDTYSRLLEPAMERHLGAQVVVENVPGAAGAVAARRISRSRPDGRTLGILNGSGLVIAPLTNPRYAPDLADDFTVLGRITVERKVLVVGPDSGIKSLEDLRSLADTRPLIVGETGPTTINVLIAALVGDLFGVDVRLVMGFPGSTEALAAVRRGDVDAAIMSVESVAPSVPVRRLMSFGAGSDATAGIEGVPNLHGGQGLLESSPELFVDLDLARRDASALSEIMAVGRLVAAPAGLQPSHRDCLIAAVESAMSDSEVRNRASRAGRSLAPASPGAVLASVTAARPHLERFKTRVDAIMQRVRR